MKPEEQLEKDDQGEGVKPVLLESPFEATDPGRKATVSRKKLFAVIAAVLIVSIASFFGSVVLFKKQPLAKNNNTDSSKVIVSKPKEGTISAIDSIVSQDISSETQTIESAADDSLNATTDILTQAESLGDGYDDF